MDILVTTGGAKCRCLTVLTAPPFASQDLSCYHSSHFLKQGQADVLSQTLVALALSQPHQHSPAG